MSAATIRYLIKATLLRSVLPVFHQYAPRSPAGRQVQRRFLLAAVTPGTVCTRLPSLRMVSSTLILLFKVKFIEGN